MIKSLSSYYLDIPWQSPLTGETCSSYTVKIYVWSGEKTDVPTTADYIITKDNIVGDTGTDKINIARILNDFIELTPNITTATGITSFNNQKWCKSEVYYTTTDPLDDTKQLEATDLLIKGYGYGNEGENPTAPANRIHINGKEYNVNRTSVFAIPILITDTTEVITVISRPSREIDVLTEIGGVEATNSETIRKLISVNVAETETDEYIEITFNGELITLDIIDECRYNPIDIHFFNKEGAQQSLTFFKERADKMTVTKKSYESTRGQASEGHHQFVDYNIQAKSTFTINTGFVSEGLNDDFKQLMLSTKVYVLVEGDFVPLNVLKTSIEYKTRQKDRLINYEFEFGFSYNEINNQ